MSQLPSPPDVEPGFEGQMWPAESPSSGTGISGDSVRSGSRARGLPIVLAAVGLLAAIGVAAFVMFGSRAPASPGIDSAQIGDAPSSQPTEPADARAIDAPPGFTGYGQFDGVKTFTHETTGFTVSIAPGWRLVPDAKLDKNTLMVVGDAKPSYSLASTGGVSPLAMIYTYPYRGTLAPPRFFQDLRQQLQGQDRTVGDVRLTVGLTDAGRTYVMRFTQEVNGLGEVRYTTFSHIRGDRVYQVLFSVPAEHAAEYQAVFSRMARTIAFEPS